MIRPRDASRGPDVVVEPSVERRTPFDTGSLTRGEFVRDVELMLEQFDLPTEDTPITAVSSWQRGAPPPLPPTPTPPPLPDAPPEPSAPEDESP